MIEEQHTLDMPAGNQVHTLVAEYYEYQGYKNKLTKFSVFTERDITEHEAALYAERGHTSVWMLVDFEIKTTEV